MCTDKGRTYFPVTFKTLRGRPAVISIPGLSRENPVLSHRDGLTLTHSLIHSDSPNDIVHYGLFDLMNLGKHQAVLFLIGRFLASLSHGLIYACLPSLHTTIVELPCSSLRPLPLLPPVTCNFYCYIQNN